MVHVWWDNGLSLSAVSLGQGNGWTYKLSAQDPADGCSFCRSRVIFVMVYVSRRAQGAAVSGCPGCYSPSPKGKPGSFENPPVLPARCGGFCWGEPDDPNQHCCLSCTFSVSPQHPEAGQLLLHEVLAPWCRHCCCPQCSCWSSTFCSWPSSVSDFEGEIDCVCLAVCLKSGCSGEAGAACSAWSDVPTQCPVQRALVRPHSHAPD